MKTLKKNNKGFSLVELIVVILIMAIIAVALAPQVMKWVDESKISTDNNNAANLKSSIDAAVADFMRTDKILAKVSFHVDGEISDISYDPTGVYTFFDGDGKLQDKIDEVVNNAYPAFKQTDAGYFLVEITTTGGVTVTVTTGT